MEISKIEHIESYLANEISKSDLAKELIHLSPAELEEEIALVKDLQWAIEAEGLKIHLKKSLSSSGKNRPKGIIKKILIITTIAASILLAISLLFFPKKDNYDRLYAQYEYKDPGIPITMSTSNQYELYDALTYYSEDNYKSCLEKLNTLPNKNDTVSYFSGLCKLNLNYTTDAELELKRVANTENSVFKDKAEWTLVLYYLQQKRSVELVNGLEKITSNKDHTFYIEASSLQASIQ